MHEVELSFQRLLSIWWLLLWRGLMLGTILGGAAGFVAGIMMALVGHRELGLIASGYAGLAVSPFAGLLVTHWALKKQYNDFRILLADIPAPASARAA